MFLITPLYQTIVKYVCDQAKELTAQIFGSTFVAIEPAFVPVDHIPKIIRTLDVVLQTISTHINDLKEPFVSSPFEKFFGPVFQGFAAGFDAIAPGWSDFLVDLTEQIHQHLSTDLGERLLSVACMFIILAYILIKFWQAVAWILHASRRKPLNVSSISVPVGFSIDDLNDPYRYVAWISGLFEVDLNNDESISVISAFFYESTGTQDDSSESSDKKSTPDTELSEADETDDSDTDDDEDDDDDSRGDEDTVVSPGDVLAAALFLGAEAPSPREETRGSTAGGVTNGAGKKDGLSFIPSGKVTINALFLDARAQSLIKWTFGLEVDAREIEQKIKSRQGSNLFAGLANLCSNLDPAWFAWLAAVVKLVSHDVPVAIGLAFLPKSASTSFLTCTSTSCSTKNSTSAWTSTSSSTSRPHMVNEARRQSKSKSLLPSKAWHDVTGVFEGGWEQNLLHNLFMKQVGNLVGRGGNAEVWEFLMPEGSKARVLKTTPIDVPKVLPQDMDRYAAIMRSSARTIRNEFTVLRQFDHPDIVKAFDFHRFSNSLDVSFTMERCDGDLGSLWSKGGLTDDEILRILVDVLKGLCCLHAAGFVHRDLKLANVLYTQPDSVHAAEGQTATVYKVTDFGWVTTPDVRDSCTSTPGICPYEVEQQGLITPQWDIYSLFIMLGHLLDMGDVMLHESEKNADVVRRMRILTRHDARALDFSDWFMGAPEERIDAATALERVLFIQSMPGANKFPKDPTERAERNERWRLHHHTLLAKMTFREQIDTTTNLRAKHSVLMKQIHPAGTNATKFHTVLTRARRMQHGIDMAEERRLKAEQMREQQQRKRRWLSRKSRNPAPNGWAGSFDDGESE